MEKFDKKVNNIPSKVFLSISRIDELKGRWIENTSLNHEILNKLRKTTLITSTGASTRIEGSEMSDEDVENYMRGIEITKLKDRDKEEVRGYFEVLDNVFSSYKTLFLREGTIQNLHKELMKYSEKDKLHLGKYKTKENKVGLVNKEGEVIKIIFDTTPPYLTKKEMDELIEWTRNAFEKGEIHPILIIAIFIFEFLSIHPFEDGNGRMSRILTNMLLLQSNYTFMPYVSHERIIENNKNEYYLALRACQKTKGQENEIILPWIEFFLNTLEKQAQEALLLTKKDYLEIDLSSLQLKVWNYILNNEKCSAGEISKNTKVNRATVNQILQKFMQLKKIKQVGKGRTTKYIKT